MIYPYDLTAAIRAAAPRAPKRVIGALEAAKHEVASWGAFDNALRLACLIGQCAHESGSFRHTRERMSYRTAERIAKVFPRHFRTAEAARPYVREPEKLANKVYGNRLGNGPARSGDGFRFRGAGYLHLSFRDNYAAAGDALGYDLEGNPELAAEPEYAWIIAAWFLATRARHGRTALQWADIGDVYCPTRIVNGGTNGLPDRRKRTGLALSALIGPWSAEA